MTLREIDITDPTVSPAELRRIIALASSLAPHKSGGELLVLDIFIAQAEQLLHTAGAAKPTEFQQACS